MSAPNTPSVMNIPLSLEVAISSFWLRILHAPRPRRPIAITDMIIVGLLYYTHALLVLFPKTRVYRLSILPLTLVSAWYTVACVDFALGAHMTVGYPTEVTMRSWNRAFAVSAQWIFLECCSCAHSIDSSQ